MAEQMQAYLRLELRGTCASESRRFLLDLYEITYVLVHYNQKFSNFNIMSVLPCQNLSPLVSLSLTYVRSQARVKQGKWIILRLHISGVSDWTLDALLKSVRIP